MDRTRERGFTLIELMITVAIVAILAAVAYPSYTKYIARAKRSAAEAFMMNVQSKQEQYMLNARSYFAAATGAASEWTAAGVSMPADVSDNYTVTVVVVTAANTPPSYTITAAPKAAQATNDAKCGTLSLTNAGVKSVTGTATDCWSR